MYRIGQSTSNLDILLPSPSFQSIPIDSNMVFCGLFSPIMNWIKPSPNKNNSPVRTDMRSKYSSDLKYYTSACQQDSDLKTFDSSLRQRADSVMKLLVDQAKSQSISQGSLVKVYEFMLDLNRDVVKEIIGSREDVRNNKDLTSLVDVYFKNTSRTLDFCNTVQNCVKVAENSRLIIQHAVNQFEEESVDAGNKKSKYVKTLEELNKFKAVGDPFEGEFLTQYESVCEEQVMLLEELSKLRAKLDKKQRNLKTWRKLSNVVFITAFVCVLLLSVSAAAMSAPIVLTAVAAGLTAPIEAIGKWSNKMWKKYEKAVKRQRGLLSTVEAGAKVNRIATDSIRLEVDNLRIKISSILWDVDFSVQRGGEENELATKLAMQEIKKKVDELTEIIKEVGQHTDTFRKTISSERRHVLKHILSLPATANSVS